MVKSVAQEMTEQRYQECYDQMNLLVGSNTFEGWPQLNKLFSPPGYKDWLWKRFFPWCKKNHPVEFENTQKYVDYGKETGLIRNKSNRLSQVLDEELIDAKYLKELYQSEVKLQIKGKMGDKIRAMLESMEDDLVMTRSVTLQACMLAITGYFASIQKRVKEGKEIYTKEFAKAYEIYKTEMGEPIKIKETRMKTMQVTLQVPVSKDEVKRILGKQMNQDLEIEVADVFKEKLDEKFNFIEAINDKSRGPISETGGDQTTTQTEEVPGDSTLG